MEKNDDGVTQDCGKTDAKIDIIPDPKQKSSVFVCCLCSGDIFILINFLQFIDAMMLRMKVLINEQVYSLLSQYNV